MEYQNFIKSKDVDINKASKILKQYLKLKSANADSIVFFRLGDFYETYFEDAYILSKTCGVILTKRKFTEIGEILMAGVPKTSATVYIAKLVAEKYKVAIVEQIQNKSEVKKGDIIEREVVRTYSPGTLIDEDFLDSNKNNFIASILKSNDRYGFSYADISTGEFFITEGNLDEIFCELSKINPSELLLSIKAREIEPLKAVPEKEADIDEKIWKNYPYTLINRSFYNADFNSELQNENLLEYEIGLKCAGSIVNYAKLTQKNFMPKLDIIKKYSISNHLIMNAKTREALELNKNSSDGKKYGSIFWAVDRCKTPMGKRLLAYFLNEPLYNISEIEKRLDGVEELIKNETGRKKLAVLFENLADISRLSSKLSNGTVTPKELVAIKSTLMVMEEFINICKNFNSEILKISVLDENLINFREIIERSINEEPANNLRTGGIIKDGANGLLDNIRAEILNTEDEIKKYEKDLILKSGVKNLKINYAKNTGYSIDVPVLGVKDFTSNIDNYARKQKLSSVEKFSTDILKSFEDKVLSLRLKAYELEYDIFTKLREYAKELTQGLRDFSNEVAAKDVLLSFADVAFEYDYVRPKFVKEYRYNLKEGMHPVLMQLLTSKGGHYDSLDAEFDHNKKCMILTGANMSGKSTYLRQIAALNIMAQTGSFVPANSFELNITDKIFLRMGSYDDMLNNCSAFMCEMLDVAEILRNATSDSLILLDETGKSTTYFEGISVSYGIIKYIMKYIGAKTVLATHFSGLSKLSDEDENIKNYRLVIDKNENILKRCIEKGVSAYGDAFNVGAEAKLPAFVLERARDFYAKF